MSPGSWPPSPGGALRHLNLDHVGVHRVGRRHAEAAGGYLFDARHLAGAVAHRIFAAFAGVGEAAEAVHGDRQRLVRFQLSAPIDIAAVSKRLNSDSAGST